MKTLPLRMLLREPLKVKRITNGGASVRITHNGKRLWVLQPDIEDELKDDRELDEFLEESRRMKISSISASKILEDSRR
jgi:hypothetical protein